MFTGRIRHLGFEILMWFVAQPCEFISLYFLGLRCFSLLLSQNHKTTSWDYERQKQKAKYFALMKAASKQSSESDRPRGESSLRASDWNDVLD